MDFQIGHNEFIFPNGDKYVGSFCAHRSGCAWRQGFGMYITHDGHTYSCDWNDDKIDETQEVEILYPNQDKYVGKIVKFQYNGPGSYILSNGSRLTANFVNNKPNGGVIFVDKHGFCWFGQAKDNEVVLLQEHVFSSELDANLGKGKSRIGPVLSTQSGTNSSVSKEILDLEEMEKIIFGKSKKTKSEIDFKDSDWYREYLLRQKMTDNRFSITKLKEPEKILYEHYLAQKAATEKRMEENKFRSKTSLLRIYFSKDYQDACPPIRIFYPTCLYDEENYE